MEKIAGIYIKCTVGEKTDYQLVKAETDTNIGVDNSAVEWLNALETSYTKEDILAFVQMKREEDEKSVIGFVQINNEGQERDVPAEEFYLLVA